MLKQTILSLALAAGFVLPATAAQAAAPNCQFILGFATMSTSVGQIGGCIDNQAFASNGDALQHTSGGLLVWRKADNWTAFTDGYHTWVNGPVGLQERLNTDRFDWEAKTPPAPAAPAATTATTTSIPSTANYTPPTAASLGLTGAAVAAVEPPVGDPPTADELAAVNVPKGAAALASLPAQVQMACVHLSQDLQIIDAKGEGSLRKGDLLCPYGSAEGWAG